ncbi:unnamed protein product, partial [Cladocopium goreaui]
MARNTGQGGRPWTTSPLALSRRTSNLLLSFGVPLLVLHLCDSIAQQTPVEESFRDLDVLDAFSGQGEVTKAFRRHKAKADFFDVETQGSSGDILDPLGFRAIMTKVLKLKEKALLMAGPPCGSWVWVNRSTSGRSKQKLFGNSFRQYVRDANSITCRLFVLALVAICRGCEVLVEQPGSSLMVHCPYVQFLALVIQPLRWAYARFPLGAWGHANQKPTVCFGTVSYLTDFKRRLTKRDHRRIQKNKAIKKHQMVRKSISKSGRVQVTGSTGMRKSATYPRPFAEALAKKHLSFM